MRRHSHWRQQQRDLAGILSLLAMLCSVLSLTKPPFLPPFFCYPRFCFNLIPSILFLQGRHVALQRNGSHATDGSAKVPRYANKMRPIRSSCVTLTTNTNRFGQSNPFVIFLFFYFFFTPARRRLSIYSVYILRVSVFDVLCSLSFFLSTYTATDATTLYSPFATLYARIHKERERKKDNLLGNNQPTVINSHVGWAFLLSGGKVYLRRMFRKSIHSGGRFFEGGVPDALSAHSQQKLIVALVFYFCMNGFQNAAAASVIS